MKLHRLETRRVRPPDVICSGERPSLSTDQMDSAEEKMCFLPKSLDNVLHQKEPQTEAFHQQRENQTNLDTAKHTGQQLCKPFKY